MNPLSFASVCHVSLSESPFLTLFPPRLSHHPADKVHCFASVFQPLEWSLVERPSAVRTIHREIRN